MSYLLNQKYGQAENIKAMSDIAIAHIEFLDARSVASVFLTASASGVNDLRNLARFASRRSQPNTTSRSHQLMKSPRLALRLMQATISSRALGCGPYIGWSSNCRDCASWSTSLNRKSLIVTPGKAEIVP